MIALWLYRRLLAFYPADVRREYGALMVEEFRDGWAEACLAGGLALAGVYKILRSGVASLGCRTSYELGPV